MLLVRARERERAHIVSKAARATIAHCLREEEEERRERAMGFLVCIRATARSI